MLVLSSTWQMLRILILVILIAAAVLLASPFVLSSLYVDQRGIAIPGRVYSKREDVTVQYSGWKRSSEVTVEYDSPDTHGVGFFKIYPEAPEFDGFHTGQKVNLHYLRRQDMPTVPLSKTLREIHALPMVRLADQRAFAGLEILRGNTITVLGVIAGFAVFLLIWRLAGWRLLGWAVGIGFVLAVAFFLNQGFPRPTPPPVLDVQKGSGRVKSLGRIDQLFESSQDEGVDAAQPIDVVGIEFIPADKTEPVLAVDLVDRGSVAGLKEKAPVTIEYERRSPRTAYIQGATRTFVSRNLSGTAVQGIICLAVVIGLVLVSLLIGRVYRLVIAGVGR